MFALFFFAMLIVEQQPEDRYGARTRIDISSDCAVFGSIRLQKRFNTGYFRWVTMRAASCFLTCVCRLSIPLAVGSEFELVKQFVSRNKLIAKSIVQDDKVHTPFQLPPSLVCLISYRLNAVLHRRIHAHHFIWLLSPIKPKSVGCYHFGLLLLLLLTHSTVDIIFFFVVFVCVYCYQRVFCCYSTAHGSM